MFKCNCKAGCGCGCGGRRCLSSRIAGALLIIGGLNWGLVGLGMLLLNNAGDWNVLHIILGPVPGVEAIVYLLVGASALLWVFGCRCKKCRDATCLVSEKTGETS
jgi:uncharacterized membrane protein YuzA (DUF378 family)